MSEISENQEPQNNPTPAVKDNKVLEPKEFAYRLMANLAVVAFIFLLGFLTLLIHTDMVENKIEDITQKFYQAAADSGLVLDDVLIIGRDKTSKNDIMRILDIKRGDNFLKIDIHALKDKLETLPWIKQAVVKRKFFPNVLEISLQEKEVRSLWQIHEKFHPIDEDGKVIDAPFSPKEPILLIVGQGAPENINQLLSEIDSNKNVLSRVKVANFISQRRWNLVLDDVENGITIKLPEKDVEKTWKKLLKLDATSGILKRKLTIIDLRLPGKVTVKLKKTDGKPPVLLKNTKERRV